ncbi:MAG: hypothetical protein K2N01_12810 [Lachnospiraceae bacterium]|nr:hypothetical protein [Lachnospiraceae bacterium]
MKNTDGEYIVINGRMLDKLPKEFVDRYFWKDTYSEKQFRKFIEDSQDFFERYQRGEDCTGYMIGNANALHVWEDRCVTVGKSKTGYGFATNGRHRIYVARKYKLNILVCVGNF